MTSGLILTNAGAAEIEAAYQAGQVISITEVALGDGGGEPVNVDPTVTALVGQFGSVPFSYGESDTDMISGQIVIPAREYAEKTLREVGLKSESGTLIAYGAYPDTWIPGQSDSIIKEIEMSFAMPLVHAESVTLVVDPNIAIITIEEGDKRYLQQALRLKEIKDDGVDAQSEARENIGCGTAAIVDVQTSRDDTTAGRILVNGGAIAIRSVRAKASGGDVAGANELPENSVSFTYPDATNSPGFSASILDYSGIGGGYNVQLAATYSNAGKNFKFRTRNGDNKTWNQWYEIYHTGNKPSADDVDALPLTGGTLTANGAFINLLNSIKGRANYLIGKDTDGANRWFIGNGTDNSYDSAFSNYKGGGNNIGLRADGAITISATNGKNVSITGQAIPSNYANFDARYQAKGNFVTGVRLGASKDITNGSGNLADQSGYVVTMGGDFGSNDGYYRLRPIQYLVNGSWINSVSA